MILDTARLIAREQPAWSELEAQLDALADRPDGRLDLAEAARLRDLYHRVCADLARVEHGTTPGPLRAYLEALAGRAYAEIYGARRRAPRFRLAALTAFFFRVPRVFRRHAAAFGLALAVTLGGCGLGALLVSFDPAGAAILLPADYLRNPAERVSSAEHTAATPGFDQDAMFSAYLISHNIRVSLLAFALGITFGLGTGLLLFQNGVLLGAVAAQYTRLGFGVFVAGWLLPHGAFEIPSVLLAGQAGFVLAAAIVRAGREPRRLRLRRVLPDLLTLLGGLCCLLVWAGLVESFFSQRHAPAIPYAAKIAVGLAELVLLSCYLLFAGKAGEAAT